METLLVGKINRLAGAYENGAIIIRFRIGSVACRAVGELASRLAEHAGYPGHEIRVAGQLSGRVLDISTLDLVD